MGFWEINHKALTYLPLEFEARRHLYCDSVEKIISRFSEAVSTIERELFSSNLRLSNEKGLLRKEFLEQIAKCS